MRYTALATGIICLLSACAPAANRGYRDGMNAFKGTQSNTPTEYWRGFNIGFYHAAENKKAEAVREAVDRIREGRDEPN